MILRSATMLAVLAATLFTAAEAGAQYYPPEQRGYDAPPPGASDGPPPAGYDRPPRPGSPIPQSDASYDRRYEPSQQGSGYGPRPEPGVAVESAPLPPPGAMPGAPRPPADTGPNRASGSVAGLPPEEQPETELKELPPQFRRQLVHYPTKEHAGTIIIDTARTYLYLVMGDGTAIRYGIGVGREGFTWAGREKVSRMAEWPDWHPPVEMIERQPYLPRFMAGGPGNPLGARALYLGNTLYRIHGTNQPSTIGQFVSSGCIRLVNDDIEDLYQRVTVGSPVVVLQNKTPASASISR